MALGAGTGRVKPSAIDPPADLRWTSEVLPSDLDMVGEIELRLRASATAADVAWIATLQDVAPDGEVTDVTAGWLRASLRESERAPVAVPIGADVEYRIMLVPNARRFAAGHRIRLVLTGDDQDPQTPAIMNFRHASVGTSSRNSVSSASRLRLPVLT